jgi:hypothetical protein
MNKTCRFTDLSEITKPGENINGGIDMITVHVTRIAQPTNASKTLTQYSLALVGIVAFLGCSPRYTSLTTADYQGKQVGASSLVIAPFTSAPSIQYMGNLENEFGQGDPEQLILDHFKTDVMTRKIYRHCIFGDVKFGEYLAAPKLSEKIFDLGDMFKLHVSLPDSGTTLEFEGIAPNPEFVLFLQDVDLGTDLESRSAPGHFVPTGAPGGGMMMVGGSRAQKVLCFKADFAFWDNTLGRVVTFGRIKASQDASIVTISDWNSVDEDFIQQLLQYSPFYR